MEKEIKSLFAEKVQDFRLPRYHELPTIGLYLEQVVKYINGYVVPIGCPEITPSMVSNYVKKGLLSAPEKKQYTAEQIAYLIFISMGKCVLTIENISDLFAMQKKVYSPEIAYNYFCSELENMLHLVCGIKNESEEIGVTNTELKYVFRSVIIALANILYVNNAFYCASISPDTSPTSSK